jgi:hypothetical protein
VRVAANRAVKVWHWASIALLVVAGGCDVFSFPEPKRTSLGDPCPPSADCGVGSSDELMTCARASALGGTDFCAPSCTPGTEPPEGQVCSRWGALLPVCHPHLAPAAADCPAGLNCYRTSLFEDQGVCMKMPVCADDSDCRRQDSIHTTCAATVARRVGGVGLAALPLDHLNCIKQSCIGLHTQCPANESCLASQYDASVADICVPSCDATRPCPPNYSCIFTALEHQEPVGLCMPGLPGIRCEPGGCIAGSCEDTGAGFNVCATKCETTHDCQDFSGAYDAFVCVEGVGHRHCVTPRAFHGNNCNKDEECRQDLDEFCSPWLPRGLDKYPGGCRQRCSAEGTCGVRGGLQHTCLWGGAGGCYPGTQGLPCQLQDECIELGCLEVPPEPDLVSPPTRICTQPCDGPDEAARDAVCDKRYDVNGGGYCAFGFCRVARLGGASCNRNEQCKSRQCDGMKCLP